VIKLTVRCTLFWCIHNYVGVIRGIPSQDTALPATVANAAYLYYLLLTAGRDAVRLVPSLNVQRVDVAVDIAESVLGEMVKTLSRGAEFVQVKFKKTSMNYATGRVKKVHE